MKIKMAVECVESRRVRVIMVEYPELILVHLPSRYCLNKAGLNSVKKILLCLGRYFPDMNFCPILPELVSLLLHFSEDEAECFHSVSRLICYNDPNKRYIDQTFLTYRASCMTFGDLANRCCRGIRKLIASSHQNLFEFYSDWIMWIFADLPFTYAIRVLDVYLLEGYKVLYRFVAAAPSHRILQSLRHNFHRYPLVGWRWSY